MNENVAEMETFFMALADRTRLRLVNLMGEGEICVCYFTAALQIAQPKISRHLAYLRRAKLVTTARSGKWIYYRIAAPENEAAKRVLLETSSWLANDKQMQQDRIRLREVNHCQPDEMPTAVWRAPHRITFDEPNIDSNVFVRRQIQSTGLADYLL